MTGGVALGVGRAEGDTVDVPGSTDGDADTDAEATMLIEALGDRGMLGSVVAVRFALALMDTEAQAVPLPVDDSEGDADGEHEGSARSPGTRHPPL